MAPEIETSPEERRRAVRALPGLRGAEERCLAALAAASVVRAFDAGQGVFEEGSPARELHLCLSGRFALAGRTPFSEQPLGDARPGQWLAAAEALLAARHAGRAVAAEPSRLLSVPASRLGPLLAGGLGPHLLAELCRQLKSLDAELPKFFSGRMTPDAIATPASPSGASLSAAEKAEALARGGLAAEDLDLLASGCHARRYAAGDVIFREGDPGEELFAVARGAVRISRRIPGAGEEALAVLRTGEFFGEVALFDPDVPGRTADAIAQEETVLLSLDRAVLAGVVGGGSGSSELAPLLCRIVAARVLDTSARLIAWRHLSGPF